ncbi:hypothetical protein V6K52_04585 [Knoellia sp. S7-12]|uniref:hypothetical protein n=1 Tax=Knoellia sp. S7-12 TaxID=3126698 RepID=UPI003369A34A
MKASRWAGGVTLAYAVGFGLPAIPIAAYVRSERALPWLWDLFPMYGGPWWDALTVNQFIATLLAFAGVTGVVAVGGVLLLSNRRLGAILAVAPIPVEVAFWIGFALPIPPVMAVARVALVVAAWRRLAPVTDRTAPA